MMNGLFASALFTIHQGQDGGRGLSPRLWKSVAQQSMSPDGLSQGYMAGDDFRTVALTTAVSANVGRYAGEAGGYLSYEDTGGAIAQLATESGGVLNITTDGTDNDEMWLQPGMATSVLGMISDTAGSDKKLIFEARFRVSKVTNTLNYFIGLSEEGLAAADTVTDAGALASKDLIGFWVTEADGDSLKFGYRKAGQALTTVGTFGTALAASTWYKVGFIYDPAETKKIRFYVDNVEQTDYVTATNIAAATFPDGEELNFLAGVKNGTAAISYIDLDWWNFFQAG